MLSRALDFVTVNLYLWDANAVIRYNRVEPLREVCCCLVCPRPKKGGAFIIGRTTQRQTVQKSFIFSDLLPLKVTG